LAPPFFQKRWKPLPPPPHTLRKEEIDMPRKPKPKNTLSAGERAALYEAEQAEKRAQRQTGSSSENQGTTDKPTPTQPEKAKVELPKPQYATVKVDLSMRTGKVKPMHGMCNGPVSYGANISSLFREIGVPYVRFDGTDSPISAYAVDISRIFKDPDADPKDSSNYDFTYTDKYVAAAYNAGCKVIFRLGESVDHLGSGKKIPYPTDIDSFVEVCANVVKHYNDYWANGYAYGIEYFEIWSSFGGAQDTARAFELYRRVSSAIKLVDSGIKVGGMCFDGRADELREFLKFCRRTRSAVDFITLSSFDSDPKDLAGRIKELVPTLYNLGFGETEIIVGAWSYIDSEATQNHPLERIMSSGEDSFAEIRRDMFNSQRQVKGAAYALAFMIASSRVNEIKSACFYDAQPGVSPWCAISDRYGNREKTFYAFRAYGDIYRAGNEIYTTCEELQGFAHSGIYAMAAEGEGAYYVLISSFDGCGIVDIRLDSIPSTVYTADIYILDGVKDMTLADSLPISGDKKRLILNISRYGAAMIKIY